MEACVVPEISSIPNTHVELVKSYYPHLKGLRFSDVSKGRDEMIIDLLVWADYLWHSQEGCTIRGTFDEPVTAETKLGWVFSGPLKCQDACADVHFTQVNFVASSVGEEERLEDVQRLWDLETLGIKKAFLNVEVDPEDRYCLGFLWVEKPPDLSQVVVYRFCTVVFGLNASPFLLNATLRHHVKRYKISDSKFVAKLLDSFYVDDFVGGNNAGKYRVEQEDSESNG